MNIPPPILENFYKQGGDDDGDDHEHEDEEGPYTQWRLATSDGSPLLVCIQPTTDVTTEGAGVVSHGRTLRTYSNTRCIVLPLSRCVSDLTLYTATKAERKMRKLNVFLLINSIACNELTTACYVW